MKNAVKRYLFPALTVFLVLFIFSNSVKDAAASGAASGRLLSLILSVIPSLEGYLDQFLLRKAAHFTEYAVLGFSLGLSFRVKISAWYREKVKGALLSAGYVLLLVPFLDETIQLFSEGRSGAVRDMWIDLAGGALGFLFLLLTTLPGKKKSAADGGDG